GREQAVSLLRPLVLLRAGGWTAIVAPTRRPGDDRLLEIVRVPLEDLGRPAGGERAVAEQRARGTIGEEDPKLRMGPKAREDLRRRVRVRRAQAVVVQPFERTFRIPTEKLPPAAGDVSSRAVPVVMRPVVIPAVEVREHIVGDVLEVEDRADGAIGLEIHRGDAR